MVENKKTSKSSFWQRFRQILKSSKRFWIYFLLFIIFILSIFVLWEKYRKDKTLKFPQVAVKVESLNSKISKSSNLEVFKSPNPEASAPNPEAPQSPNPEASVPNLEAPQSPNPEASESSKERDETIEVAPKNTQGYSQQLITIQLLEGVLEGWIPLSTFKTYLQKRPHEYTLNLLLELSTISNCPTYAELQSSLPSIPVKSKSLWERLKSLIRVKKMGQEKALEKNSLRKIEKAIYERNMPEVLNLFEALPEDEKAHFSPWMEKVQERLKVEMLYKHLLVKLAQGQNG